MPLSMMKQGKTAIVKFIDPKTPQINKLAAMGLTCGVKLTVKSGYFGGPMVIELRGSIIALGHDITSNVYVETHYN